MIIQSCSGLKVLLLQRRSWHERTHVMVRDAQRTPNGHVYSVGAATIEYRGVPAMEMQSAAIQTRPRGSACSSNKKESNAICCNLVDSDMPSTDRIDQTLWKVPAQKVTGDFM